MRDRKLILRVMLEAADGFIAHCRAEGVKALLLHGSVAREEVHGFWDGDHVHALGDIDLLVVDDRCEDGAFVRAAERVAEQCVGLPNVRGYLWHIGAKYRTPGELAHSFSGFEREDLLRESRVLHGDIGVLKELESASPPDSVSQLEMLSSRLYCNLQYWPSVVYVLPHKPEVVVPDQLKQEILVLLAKTLLLIDRVQFHIDEQDMTTIPGQLLRQAHIIREGGETPCSLHALLFAFAGFLPRMLDRLVEVRSEYARNMSYVSILFHMLLLTAFGGVDSPSGCLVDISHLQKRLLEYMQAYLPVIARGERYRAALAETRSLAARRWAFTQFGQGPILDIERLLPRSRDDLGRICELALGGGSVLRDARQDVEESLYAAARDVLGPDHAPID